MSIILTRKTTATEEKRKPNPPSGSKLTPTEAIINKRYAAFDPTQGGAGADEDTYGQRETGKNQEYVTEIRDSS